MKQIGNQNRTIKRVAVTGLCAGLSLVTTIQSIAGTVLTATSSDAARLATSSNAYALEQRSLETGDFWKDWIGDLSFLSGTRGEGTQEKPYQISTKEHLMGLSELVSMGMVIEENEGTYPGDYRGAYFELVRDLDLGGMKWNPIGFYRDETGFYTGEVYPFHGHFNGNGKTISNFRIADSSWKQVGLFGVIRDAEIQNLHVKPGYVLYGKEQIGILAGQAENSEIRNVSVNGTVKADGTAGGLVGVILEGTVIENCTADHIAIDSGTKKEVYTGGIAGKAAESLIVDCTVNTGDSYTARIQGGGHVGGVVGFQNGTDIFNVHVMGTIGGSGSQSIGGVTGKYASGKMKVARFEGTIASSGLGSLAHEGTFIGTHGTGFHFRYGIQSEADLAYLYADTEAKIAAGICGSGIPDDNSFGYDAHIGFWHGKDNFFTLVQGANTRSETEKYFFEELEEGMLCLIDTETFARDMVCTPDHFAPNAVGRPTRGYLVSVLQVDTVANVEHYYDVAALTAKGESVYSKVLDKDSRGAVAAGDVVTVMTSPNNTESEKYQLVGVPTYTKANGKRTDMGYQTGGSYSFVMPDHDTEISAVYKKVAAEIRVVPTELAFKVIQERTGNRKQPSIVTEVRNGDGKLIARYLNDQPETKVQDITVEAVVDRNNDVADSRVRWSVDDSDLLKLKKNGDEDNEGYTAQSASLELNLQADFFQTIIQQAEAEQAENQYRYAIPDTIYGNGIQGGLAVLTAQTRPAASFEGKPVSANCRIPVTFQIKDRTYVQSEAVVLDQQTMEFVITRTLTGNRKNPTENISVSGPKTLTATFTPEYFDKKEVIWRVNESNWISVNGEDRSAVVSAYADAKWIRDLISIDQDAHQKDWKYQQNAGGTQEAMVTVEAKDALGQSKYASCQVILRFVTKDQTSLYGSGGGSFSESGGGTSGGSSKNTTAKSSKTGTGTNGLKSITGTWKQDENGSWKFYVEDLMYCNTWAYIFNPYAAGDQNQADWFYFDANGQMVTGWHWIPGADGYERCYYLNPVSDGTQGRMYQNETTPDGYQAGPSGAWVIDGVEQIRKLS